MLDLLKKSLMAGLGAVVITRDKIREGTRSLVEEGKMSTEEAEKLADELVKSGERQWDELNSKFQSSMRKWSDNADVENKKEIQDLKARVELLEQRLGLLEESHRGASEAVGG